jgi:hypothetical protein
MKNVLMVGNSRPVADGRSGGVHDSFRLEGDFQISRLQTFNVADNLPAEAGEAGCSRSGGLVGCAA